MSVTSDLVQRTRNILKEKGNEKRILITLAGIPGSGKSTTATQVAAELNNKYGISALVVGMDGYHYTREDLAARIGVEKAVKYRGAPYTFDAEGVVNLAAKLGQRIDVSFPTFDHAVKDPVEGGGFVPASADVVILEGLYLHLRDKPWNEIMQLSDDSWFANVDFATARNRLAKRHLESGIVDSIEAGEVRADTNDLVNGKYILEHAESAQYEFSTSSTH